jgi:hypothetical protein
VPGPHNAAFAASGPKDTQGVTKPISLAILGTSTLTNGSWVPNPADNTSSPAAGYKYENPYIGRPVGSCDNSNCISDTQPAAMEMILQATVSELTKGVAYNLYEYDFPTQTGCEDGHGGSARHPHQQLQCSKRDGYLQDHLHRRRRQLYYSGTQQNVQLRAVPASAP